MAGSQTHFSFFALIPPFFRLFGRKIRLIRRRDIGRHTRKISRILFLGDTDGTGIIIIIIHQMGALLPNTPYR